MTTVPGHTAGWSIAYYTPFAPPAPTETQGFHSAGGMSTAKGAPRLRGAEEEIDCRNIRGPVPADVLGPRSDYRRRRRAGRVSTPRPNTLRLTINSMPRPQVGKSTGVGRAESPAASSDPCRAASSPAAD